VLTHHFAKVRLVKVKYIDTDNHFSPIERYGFFVENFSNIAKRKKFEMKKEDGMIDLSKLSFRHFIRQSFFQFMIGNDDHLLTENFRHNYVLFQNSEKYIPMAFDFNQSVFSGFTNRRQSSLFSARRIPCHLYKREVFLKTLEDFLNKKEMAIDLIREEKGLDQNIIDSLLEYMEANFSVLEKILAEGSIYLNPYLESTFEASTGELTFIESERFCMVSNQEDY
jgi:hypothetical protein